MTDGFLLIIESCTIYYCLRNGFQLRLCLKNTWYACDRQTKNVQDDVHPETLHAESTDNTYQGIRSLVLIFFMFFSALRG